MWSEETRNVNGTYDVDDSVSAFIRTTGPVITLEGAWAQNIEEEEPVSYTHLDVYKRQPFYYRCPREGRERLLAQNALTVKVEVEFTVLTL